MLNKIKYIANTAAIFMAACVFTARAENYFICANTNCTLLCVNGATTNSFELSEFNDTAKWYQKQLQYAGSSFTVVRPGYSCSWYTLASDSTRSAEDQYSRCTVSLNNATTTITASQLDKAKRCYFGPNHTPRMGCAKLSPAQYTVTFNPCEGSVSPSSSVVTFDAKYASDSSAWPTPARTGYAFAGWFTAKSGGTQIFWNTIVSTPSNHTVYAQWQAKNYAVTLYPGENGSVSPSSLSVTYGQTYGDLPTPHRDGYDFRFWSLRPDGGNPIYSTNIVTTADNHCLYAKWENHEFEVTLDPCGGKINSSFVNPTRVRYLNTFNSGSSGALPKGSKNGYDFRDWYSEPEGQGDLIEGTTMFTYLSDITIYADYTPQTYKLYFRPEADGVTMDMNDKDIVFDAEYGALASASRKGYVFGGWYTEKDGGGTRIWGTNKVTSTANPQYLYAKWTEEPYEVTFDFVGGSNGTENVSVIYGKTVPDIVIPEKGGFAFVGYYDNVDYQGTSYYSSNGKGYRTWDKESGAILYARWGEKTYTVTFDRCGGTGGTSTLQAKYQGTMSNISVPSKVGYAFAGYFTEKQGLGVQYFDADGKPLETWQIAADATLYANWTPITYTVSFAGGDGGVGEMSDQVFTYDKAQALSPNGFTRPGLTFVKWKKSTSEFFTDGQVVSNLTTKAGATLTLTAQWSKTTYVKFVSEQGEGAMDLEVFEDAESKPLTSNAFTRVGYTFDHWTNRNAKVFADGQLITNSLYVSIAQTNVLHAVWSNNVYTIAFNGNGATNVMDSVTAMYDVSKQVSNGFVHPDLAAEFIGWGLSSDTLEYPLPAGKKYVTVSNLTATAGATVTLYARWSIDYGPLSKALDCDNLKFTGTQWHVTNSIPNAYHETCVICDDNDWGEGQVGLFATGLSGSGTLEFFVNLKYADADSWMQVWIGSLMHTEIANGYPGRVPETWFKVSLDLKDMKPDQKLEIRYNKGIPGWEEYCAIDHLTWTPNSEHPEPTPADAPTISGAATIVDGKFRVTFAADKRFKYELIKTASLAPVDWKSFEPQLFLSPSSDGTVSFEPEIKAEEPQLFYRVKVLKKD